MDNTPPRHVGARAFHRDIEAVPYLHGFGAKIHDSTHNSNGVPGCTYRVLSRRIM